jgi:hypothetical protein
MFHNFFLSNAVEVMGASAVVGPLFVILIGIYLVWFANDAKSKGWLS